MFAAVKAHGALPIIVLRSHYPLVALSGHLRCLGECLLVGKATIHLVIVCDSARLRP